MRGINKVILVGHLGKDPKVNQASTGMAMASCSIATPESWKDKTTGEKQERTEWHNVVFFGKLAEIAGAYLKKGGQVYIEGRLRTRKWQDKEGMDRYTTEVVANDMQMLGGRGAGSSQTTQHKEEAEPTPSSLGPESFSDFDDSDIPF